MKNVHRLKGFTIIEMLAVTAIITLISASIIANYRGGNRQAELRNAAQEVVSVMRRAQAASLSGLQYNGDLPQDYRVFVSETANTPITICASSPNCAQNVIESVKLPSEVYVYRITKQTSSPIEFDYADIIFTSPYADISFVGSTLNNENTRPLKIELRNQSGDSMTIEVNPLSGKFDISAS